MKKLIFFLPALLMLAFSSCSDDDDLPMVDIEASYSGGVMVDGKLYIVQDEEFEITSVSATPLREGAKAAITSVVYGLDGWVIGASDIAPFGVTFEPETFATGKHVLSMRMMVAEEGCTPAVAYSATDVIVVASADLIPTPSESDELGVLKIHPSIQTQ